MDHRTNYLTLERIRLDQPWHRDDLWNGKIDRKPRANRTQTSKYSWDRRAELSKWAIGRTQRGLFWTSETPQERHIKGARAKQIRWDLNARERYYQFIACIAWIFEQLADSLRPKRLDVSRCNIVQYTGKSKLGIGTTASPCEQWKYNLWGESKTIDYRRACQWKWRLSLGDIKSRRAERWPWNSALPCLTRITDASTIKQ